MSLSGNSVPGRGKDALVFGVSEEQHGGSVVGAE